MADWDQDSPQLAANIASVANLLDSQAKARVQPTLALIKSWHAATMLGLTVPNPAFVGSFRGEPGLIGVGVTIGGVSGVRSTDVAGEVATFEKKLRSDVAVLDKAYPPGVAMDVAGFAKVINLAAWAHSEWVRIHPFANGNGRTARFLANFIFTRYDIGPVVRVRPRPGGEYEKAAKAAMSRDPTPTAGVFVDMIAAQVSPASTRKAKAAARPKSSGSKKSAGKKP